MKPPTLHGEIHVKKLGFPEQVRNSEGAIEPEFSVNLIHSLFQILLVELQTRM